MIAVWKSRVSRLIGETERLAMIEPCSSLAFQRLWRMTSKVIGSMSVAGCTRG